MATVSPTPMGQGSHFTSLGRRTSARQALRRPPSRSQMGPGTSAASMGGSKRNSTTTGAPADAASSQQQQQYNTLHDSSDDEMPIPMKLSALTKALLNDGASASEESAAAVAAAAAAAAGSSAPAVATRRRSALSRSTSSAAGAESDNLQSQSQQDRPGVRQTRRNVRANSVQPSSAAPGSAAPSSSSRPTSPPLLRSRDSSPAPRKRVVRLSSTTPAGGMPAQPPIHRSLSASKHSGTRRAATLNDKVATDEKGSQSAELPATSSAALVSGIAATAEPASIDAIMASAPADNINTPASAVRRVQIAVGSSAGRSSRTAARLSASSSALRAAARQTESAAGHHSDSEPAAQHEPPSTVGRTSQQQQGGSAVRSYGVGSSGSSAARSGGSREADQQQALQTSIRVKRVGKVLGGGFLSGPARRGRRRTSEEEGGDGHSPHDLDPQHHDGGDLLVSSQESAGSAMRSSHAAQGAHSGSRSPYYDHYARDYPAATGSPVSAKNTSALRAGRDLLQQHESQPPQGVQPEPELQRRRSFKVEDPAAIPLPTKAAALPLSTRPNLPSANDQENEAPYLVSAAKPLVAGAGDKMRAALQPVDVKIPTAMSKPAAATVSPERKALAAINRNTPHRPAPPPPPKMSVLETATAATAGAAGTAQAKKQPRILLKVNGRSYQRVDCIGRGGSAKVYKVTAENGKMFAMKRVSLENTDELQLRGYLGEIDLLKKLSGVDRAIQLFDFEMNKEKQMLSLLMELGEMDLNSLLRVRQNPESAKLDPVFVRFYWKEMLECLQAVHAHDIVHSDLKPANFVLVQGRLKLIDFGIAGAIQTEMTVNVHRENQVGTPSYMSPESLMDAQQYAFTANHNGRHLGGPSRGAQRLVKVGKPSDVWSLGCILYQMVYGLPPFGHIQNQMARCQAIITWTHAIDFPARGLGGAPVPPSLLATMKRCLNREQQLRPTCEDLLSPTDPFLYPEAQQMLGGVNADGTVPISEELLGRIIQSVVTRCRERMPTDGEAMSAWPAAYWASVRRAVAARDERQQ